VDKPGTFLMWYDIFLAFGLTPNMLWEQNFIRVNAGLCCSPWFAPHLLAIDPRYKVWFGDEPTAASRDQTLALEVL